MPEMATNANEDHYSEWYSFPGGRELNDEGIINAFGFVDGRIGTDTDIPKSGESSSRYTIGFTSKAYKVNKKDKESEGGMAYLELSFGITGVPNISPEKQLYSSVSFDAKTLFKKRIDLTRKLSAEVVASLELYFETIAFLEEILKEH
jgi:hypothetical protein